MVPRRPGRISVVVAGLLMIGIAPAFGALSATAAISTPSTGPTYNYTIQLQNTGTTDIGTFWFAWTPPAQPTEYDFLPSLPSATGYPTGWVGPPSPGFPGNSIEYYNLGGAADDILPGQTGTFTFTTTDSPTTLQGTVFGFPITESFIYAGFPEEGTAVEVDPVFVAVPEPTSLVLLALGCGGAAFRRRRRASAWRFV